MTILYADLISIFYEVLLFLEQEKDMMPELYAHEALLYTALINLIENGAKFSDNKTVSVKIECVDNGAKVSIHNTGKIIPEKEIQEIDALFLSNATQRHIIHQNYQSNQ